MNELNPFLLELNFDILKPISSMSIVVVLILLLIRTSTNTTNQKSVSDSWIFCQTKPSMVWQKIQQPLTKVRFGRVKQ